MSTRSGLEASTLGKTFFDTNVLVYAFDDTNPAKQTRAQELLSDIPVDSIVVSGQVLSEFYWITTRRIQRPLSPSEALAVIGWLAEYSVVPIDGHLVGRAIELSESAGIAYWDALIVSAAASMSCERVLTEDLNHSQLIDSVKIENPFIGL